METNLCVEHDKCYSPIVIATNPPILEWICRRCGAKGQDRPKIEDSREYEVLIDFWAKRGN